ncbi:uncharacterized protein LOC111895188 isoform X2 [Lactuca sativa]|uniref:uncharacterized protein LOC111895188 isoform X2 n=1 Tax=Lactuca sativa TaxID=4236 RepID=UPI000CD92338|nr:uncharacterized protein LOC111895188 isoform X2 [Lactuca sativa]XP_023747060.1 uncharacterized protein LOC111895188 isoform X2 [Lactuca sativa]XP_052620552.1 uncharacterized protein LOC111895188 isoform X2 [Lactuca sativa]
MMVLEFNAIAQMKINRYNTTNFQFLTSHYRCWLQPQINERSPLPSSVSDPNPETIMETTIIYHSLGKFYMECGKEVQLKVVLGIHVFFPNLRLDSTGIKPISRPCSFVPLDLKNFNGFQKKNISITKNRRWLKVTKMELTRLL